MTARALNFHEPAVSTTVGCALSTGQQAGFLHRRPPATAAAHIIVRLEREERSHWETRHRCRPLRINAKVPPRSAAAVLDTSAVARHVAPVPISGRIYTDGIISSPTRIFPPAASSIDWRVHGDGLLRPMALQRGAQRFTLHVRACSPVSTLWCPTVRRHHTLPFPTERGYGEPNQRP